LALRGFMELKTARLTLLIDPNKKAAFERLCAQRDLTASQVVRQMIRDYLAQHGASFEPAGAGADEPVAKARPARFAAAPRKGTSKPKAAAKALAKTPGARRRS
jgi:Ribbon-helix-helix protein